MRDAEIRDPRATAPQQHIRGLEVTVNHTAPMRAGKAVEHAAKQRVAALGAQRIDGAVEQRGDRAGVAGADDALRQTPQELESTAIGRRGTRVGGPAREERELLAGEAGEHCVAPGEIGRAHV